MKKLLLILLCLPYLFSCKGKEKKEDNRNLSKELATDIIKELDSINNKKKEINFLRKEKNSLNNQIKEDSIKKALLEYNICNQEKIARQKYKIKKNNEDIFIVN